LQDAKKKEQVIKAVEHEERVQHSAELNQSQYETWDFLIDHDCPQGVPVSGIARALNTTAGAISHRMSILVNRGYAVRTQRGYYRARTP
jgi:DNA-binding MarR family transcriptional regulator